MELVFDAKGLKCGKCKRKRSKFEKAILTVLESIMSTQTELVGTLAAITDQVTKIGTETSALLTKITELTDALAVAGNTTPEVDAAIAALQAQASVVDDLVPDAAT